MSLPSTVADDWANTVAPANPATANNVQKKPRHRHAPEQLAALNELFEKDEHPPLDVRSALAERLGMETKTVNAWFQNKRASSKKRTRNLANDRANGSHLNSGSASSPATATTILNPPVPTSIDPPQHLVTEDDYHTTITDLQHPVPSKIAIPDIVQAVNLSTFSAHSDYPQLSSGRSSPDMPKKMRMRPSSEQTEELKKLYNNNPHPTAEERQALADRIGMRYQSITNWFQNQRSLAKRRKDDEPLDSAQSTSRTEYPSNDSRQYAAFPPPPLHHLHPSLTALSNTALSNPDPHVTASKAVQQRSPSLPPLSNEVSPRRSMRRSVTPYSNSMSTRPRRSRPEPFQLDALKDLFTRTSTPTIEERSALALEIGMDVGKVTNWFRNLRQTTRKRSSRFNDHDQEEEVHSGLEEDDAQLDGDRDDFGQYPSANFTSRSASRPGTPSLSARSSSSSSVDADVRMRDPPHSNVPSDDEDYSEAITPEPGKSPSPTPGSGGFERRELPRPIRDESHLHLLPPPASSSDPYHYSNQPYLPPPAPRRYPHSMELSGKSILIEKTASPELSSLTFNANVAIFDSSYHPASKSYYANEDPVTCAATAKRFGINIEDAYLLLDFHRQ